MISSFFPRFRLSAGRASRSGEKEKTQKLFFTHFLFYHFNGRAGFKQ